MLEEDQEITINNGLGYVVENEIMMRVFRNLTNLMSNWYFRPACDKYPESSIPQRLGGWKKLKDQLNVIITVALVQGVNHDNQRRCNRILIGSRKWLEYKLSPLVL